MSNPDQKDAIGAAFTDLLCISEIMQALADNALQEEGTVPAAWMHFLGDCIGDAAHRISENSDAN